MTKIYQSFEELLQHNSSVFKFVGKDKHRNLYQAVWEARQTEIDQLKHKIGQLEQASSQVRKNTKVLKNRIKQGLDDLQLARTENEQQVHKLRHLTLDRAQLQEELEQVYEEMDLVRADLEESQADNSRHKKGLSRLREHLQKAKNYTNKVKRYAVQLKEFAEQAKQDQKKAELHARKMQARADEAIDQTHRTKEFAQGLQKQYQEAQNCVVHLNEENHELSKKLQEVRKQLHYAREQQARNAKENNILQEEKRALLSEVAQMNQIVLNVKNAMGTAPEENLKKRGGNLSIV